MFWEIKSNQLLLGIKSNIMDSVLDKVHELIETMTEYASFQYKKKFGYMSEYEKKWIRLHVTKDLISAFEVWTNSDDIIVDFNISGSVNSVIKINCAITRDYKIHSFDTNIMWTGLKYRNKYFNFITKTTLEYTKRKDMSKRYEKDILNLIVRRNLENQIYFTELNVNRIRCNLLLSEHKSESEIIKSQKKIWHEMLSLTWDQAIALGFDISYESESEFLIVKEEASKYALNRYREIRINRARKMLCDEEDKLKYLKEKYKTL